MPLLAGVLWIADNPPGHFPVTGHHRHDESGRHGPGVEPQLPVFPGRIEDPLFRPRGPVLHRGRRSVSVLPRREHKGALAIGGTGVVTEPAAKSEWTGPVSSKLFRIIVSAAIRLSDFDQRL